MKIAFLEYIQYLTNGGDERFALCWIELLKNFGHQVDVYQYSNKIKQTKCNANIQIKYVKDVHDFDDYDIVIINNLYAVRHQVTQDFLDFVCNIRAKTLYINHERSTLQFLFKGNAMYSLMHCCDATICYYDNIIKRVIDPKKVHKITFGHFYKPNEDNDSITYNKIIDMLYLARLNRVKGFYKYVEHANELVKNSNFNQFNVYGYVGSIGHVQFREMPEMIQEFAKEPFKNTDSSFIHLNRVLDNRNDVVRAFKQSHFSWNAYSFECRGKSLYNVIDNGLEASPLEAIRYGCVPILNKIHEDIDIPISSGDLSQTVKFKDCNCAIFIDDNTSSEELLSMLRDELSTHTKLNNCRSFTQILNCKSIYHETLMKTFNSIIHLDYNRNIVKNLLIKDVYDRHTLLQEVKIR